MGCLAAFYDKIEKKCFLTQKQYQSGGAGFSLQAGTTFYHRKLDFCPTVYDYEWSSDGSTCFRYGDATKWDNANAACREDGGRLMQVETVNKNSVMVEIINTYKNGVGMVLVFFGMVDYKSEASPRWADGSQISGYENWYPGSLDSDIQECGVYHRKTLSEALQWEDQLCNANYNYVCEVVLD
ncbi:snaclec subunit A-like [Haliotis rubra]|uniref:snaclec subunit A-like n=1 Tax=Haliotis rubra TaxID=36100 RepID=UPI001EE5FCC0|nr:snaclec subunit A-like [Haliotis rubra]